MFLVDLGLMTYNEAWNIQLKINEAVRQNKLPDVLLLVEHPPVLTVGRDGKENNLLFPPEYFSNLSVEVFNVDRGGDVTYHGPGQLVGYPILDLKARGRDLLQYIRTLEKSVINLLAQYDIQAGTIPGLTGVWAGNEKICAIGVGARAWVTKHGFALNVNTNLEHFSWIVPCGLRNKGVTSMEKLLGHYLDFSEVKNRYAEVFAETFRVSPENIHPCKLKDLLEQVNEKSDD